MLDPECDDKASRRHKCALRSQNLKPYWPGVRCFVGVMFARLASLFPSSLSHVPRVERTRWTIISTD